MQTPSAAPRQLFQSKLNLTKLPQGVAYPLITQGAGPLVWPHRKSLSGHIIHRLL